MEDLSVCRIKGCNSKVLAAGLCNKHWRRNKKYGSPVLLMKPAASYRGLPAVERFFHRVNKTDTCWLWTSGKDKDGYGLFMGEANGVLYKRAHRWSWAYHNKSAIDPDLQVCHSCDVPQCVNPAHLRLDTGGENQREKWRKGRGTVKLGSKASAARLTEKEVMEIRASAEMQKVLAARYRVTQSTISDIKCRRSWTHI